MIILQMIRKLVKDIENCQASLTSLLADNTRDAANLVGLDKHQRYHIERILQRTTESTKSSLSRLNGLLHWLNDFQKILELNETGPPPADGFSSPSKWSVSPRKSRRVGKTEKSRSVNESKPLHMNLSGGTTPATEKPASSRIDEESDDLESALDVEPTGKHVQREFVSKSPAQKIVDLELAVDLNETILDEVDGLRSPSTEVKNSGGKMYRRRAISALNNKSTYRLKDRIKIQNSGDMSPESTPKAPQLREDITGASGPLKVQFPPSRYHSIITPTDLKLFKMDHSKGVLWSDIKLTLDIIEDDYKQTFSTEENLVFVVQKGTEPGNLESSFVVVLHEPVEVSPNTPLFRALRITKQGHEQLSLPLHTLSDDIVDCLTESIQKAEREDCQLVYHVCNPSVRQELFKIEQKHPQHVPHTKIALVYCRQGQTNPLEMLQNTKEDCSTQFWNFVSVMGYKIDLTNWDGYTGDMKHHQEKETYYTKWKDKDIIFHVAPLLDTEGQRRLVGNDITIIVFIEEGEFNPSLLENFGTVPQLIFIVRAQPWLRSSSSATPPSPLIPISFNRISSSQNSPTSSSDKIPIEKLHHRSNSYRLAFFQNAVLPSIDPLVPDVNLDENQLRDLLFTKAFNGILKTRYHPPLKRFFCHPRQETIKDIADIYPYQQEKKDKKLLKEKNYGLYDSSGWFKGTVLCNEKQLPTKKRCLLHLDNEHFSFYDFQTRIKLLDVPTNHVKKWIVKGAKVVDIVMESCNFSSNLCRSGSGNGTNNSVLAVNGTNGGNGNGNGNGTGNGSTAKETIITIKLSDLKKANSYVQDNLKLISMN